MVTKFVQPLGDEGSERNASTTEQNPQMNDARKAKSDGELDKMLIKEYDSYMDDEDLEKDYGDTESSGFNDRQVLKMKLKLNETFDYEDQEQRK